MQPYVGEGQLEDAHFTFERDVAKGIEKLAEELGAITFVAGAGSFAEKAARLQELVAALGGGEASHEAARLAKADQAAELVREFPDLEGHIGAEYARLAGFPEGVCAAIEEHYLPDSADGPLPHTEPGRVLAAAEKLFAEVKHPKEPLFAFLTPALSKVRSAQGRLEQRLAMLRHVEAVRMYAAAHDGKLPAKLSDCPVPLPVDPFTGKPFRYEVDGETAHLRGSPPPAYAKIPAFNVHYQISVRK